MDVWSPMPTLIFGVLSVVTGAVCFLMPETKGCPLPDTLEDAELIGRGRHRDDVTRQGEQDNTLEPPEMNFSSPFAGFEDKQTITEYDNAVFVDDSRQRHNMINSPGEIIYENNIRL